ncbi:hypothetical protein BKA58DRAFT_94029 [Alternaria rosae]|uniref:uncharacterized protein n=1 Tax=Alternaria rosae TaxID=1187941 RepID=UPI001E8CB114|nr:uncharacterized protein BKA58DRAFT_94029 [Alternaria rosae]KAH6878365.1 hypothetical protein BKA58DRAFT_94029 [Alternaria rosae]
MTLLWFRRWASPCGRACCINLLLRLFPIIRLRRSTKYQQPPLRNIQDTMAAATAQLISLPTELILDIADHLPPDAIVALQLTHGRLNSISRLNQRRWQTPPPRCVQRAIQRHLAPPSSKPTHRYCILCRVTCPIGSFKSSLSPACLPMARVNVPHNVIALPPNVCFCHVARFTRHIETAPMSGPTTGRPGRNEWVSHTVKICLHCGRTGWEHECNCECQTCLVGEVTTYTRYISNRGKKPPTFVFWRETPRPGEEGVGRLWVRETHRDATGNTSFINMPVLDKSVPDR